MLEIRRYLALHPSLRRPYLLLLLAAAAPGAVAGALLPQPQWLYVLGSLFAFAAGVFVSATTCDLLRLGVVLPPRRPQEKS